jgi:hypothetical protein
LWRIVHLERQSLSQALTPNRVLALRLGIIALAIIGIVILGVDLTRPKTAAQVIATGMSHPAPPPDLDPSDQNLDDDEAAAGAIWARAHPGASSADCPASPAAFLRGCVEAAGHR